MKKVYLFKYGLTVLFLICAISTFAQKSAFTGKVIDESNQPLPGATIRVKGTDQSTVTDLNGKFTIPANNQSAMVVIVNFIGYDAMEKTIVAGEPVTIQLVPNQKSLSEVLVVGYGTVRKKDATGSVSNIGAKDLNPGPSTNPLQQLTGKAAGVTITQTGSEPGVAPTVRIRGISSLEGGGDPLVVVDGIQGNMDLLNQVPPNEIASVDILKDASATAIYGSRGAPGVIIVTTKKSAPGKSTVEYTENTSLDVIPRKLNLLNAAQWTNEANALGVDVSANHGSNTDWYDLLTRNGITQNHSLAFGGGANEFNYRASLTAIDQTGIVLNSNYKNFIGRIVATQKALDDKLTITMNLNSGINEGAYEPNGVGNAAFTSNLISQSYIARPTDPVYNTDGTYFRDPNVFQYTNPYAVAQTVKNDVNINNLFGSLRGDLDIYKGLSAGWFGSWRKIDQQNGIYLPATSTIQTAIDNNGIGNIGNYHTDEKLMDINLSYKHDFGKSHLDATAVYEWQAQTYNGDFVQGRGFVNDLASYNALQLGDISKVLQGDISSYKNDRRLISLLGRVNYSYDDKYLFTASLRRDGATVFGVNDKVGSFPSAAVAWRITQEDFMKDQHLFSNLKLRVGYGITGNQQGIGPQNSIALVGQAGTVFFGGTTIPNYAATQNSNLNLRWETKKMANAGLDFGLFNDRLTGTVDVYTSNTDNLLFNYTVPLEGPFLTTNILANVGSLQNRGIELSLAYRVIQSDKVTLTLAGNASFMSSKVLSLGGNIEGYDIPTNYVGLKTPNVYLVVGKPIDSYLILKHSGVNAQGVETVVGEDASGNVDQGPQSKYRYDEGQALPKYNYAFTPTFTYKNFDATMVWRGSGGNKIYDGVRADLSLLENIGKQNVLTSAIPTGIHSSPFASDEWLESGNFLRWENLSFGYKVNLTDVKYISALRFSLTGQNLAIITKYKGIDPEVNTSGGGTQNSGDYSGGDFGIYPRVRTFAIGVNVVLK
jgi:TonB-dependent starch-binding outer membrane protein SusC